MFAGKNVTEGGGAEGWGIKIVRSDPDRPRVPTGAYFSLIALFLELGDQCGVQWGLGCMIKQSLMFTLFDSCRLVVNRLWMLYSEAHGLP